MTTLSDQQDRARKTVVDSIRQNNPLTYLAGYAGTGKSTLLPFILEDLGYQPDKVWFCAPTGKAAKVMRTKLKDQKYPNFHATTIHSAIYRAKQAPVAMLEENITNHQSTLSRLMQTEIEIAGYEGREPAMSRNPEIEKQRKMILRLKEELSAIYREDEMAFHINPDAPLQMCDLVVVDEASMVGRIMAADLMSFGVPILAIGDPGQLPPVKDDEGLTANTPDYFLTEIHRQAADNPIIWLSMQAREGKNLVIGKYGNGEVEVLDRRNFQEVYTDFASRPQFLCGRNKTRWKTNQYLRQDFGFVERAGDSVGPRKGEPICVRKNVREIPNLVNGTACTALSDAPLTHGQARFLMSFEDDEGIEYRDKFVYQGLFEEHFSKRPNGFTAHEGTAFRAKKNSIVMDWDYARTVHASQGAQYDNVVLIDESSCFGADMHKHLYTGITRAAKTLKVLI